MAGLFDDLIPGAKPRATGGGMFADLIPAKPKTRNPAAVANDWVIEAGNAVAGGVKSVADFVAPGNAVSSFIEDNIIKPGEASQSDAVRLAKAKYAADMEAAGGIGDEIGATLGYAASNPGIALAQAAGSFAVPGATVKGAGMLSSLGRTGVAAERAAVRGGLAGGAVAGAALSGGDAAGTAYELVMRAGGTEEQATEAARKASVLPAAIGAAGGVIGAERLLAGAGEFKGGMLSRALKTAGVEGGQEAIEEGVTQYEGQRAAVPFDPSIDPLKGVAGAATMGAVLGGATGGAVSLLSGKPAEDDKPNPVLKVLAAPSVDSAINAAKGMLALPAPASGVASELVDGVLALPGPARTAEPPMLRALPAPDGSTVYMVDEAGNVAPQPAAARAEAVTRAADADIAATQQRLADQQRQTDLGMTPGLRKAQATREDGNLQREPIPAGEATEVLPTGEVEEFDAIPAGEATEFETLPVGEILDGDLMAKDGEPFTSKTGAQAKAYASGGGKVVTVPDHFGSGIPGYVVRPLVQGRPNNTRGTNADDVARPDGQRAADPRRGDRAGVLPDSGPSDVLPSPAGAAGQGVAGPGAAGGASARTNALTVQNGLTVTFGGKTYPVESINDAQEKWEQFRASTDGSGKKGGLIVTDGAGKFVARISPNGRAWDAPEGGKAIAEAPGRTMPKTVLDDEARGVFNRSTSESYLPPKETLEEVTARSQKAADDLKRTVDAPTLTTGDRITLAGKSYTVTSATPAAVKLDDGAGSTRMVATNSKTFSQITKDDAQQATAPTQTEAPAPAAATATPAAAAGTGTPGVEADGVKRKDGRTIPKAGDEVFTYGSGMGGSRSVVAGKVAAGAGGLKVQIGAGTGMLGERVARKTIPLSSDWTLKGEEHPDDRNRRESAARLEEDSRSRRDQREQMLTDAAAKNGTLDPTTVAVGDVLEMPDGTQQTVDSIGGKGEIYASPDGSGGRYIGKDMRGIKKAATPNATAPVEAGSGSAAPAPAPAPADPAAARRAAEEPTVELRKRLSVLKALKECIG